MYPYQPKPLDLIISIPFFALSEYALSKGWDRFSFAMFVTGWVCVGFVALASLWNNVIEHNKSIRDKMDTARHLDLERLAAIGLVADKNVQPTSATRLTYEDQHGKMQRESLIELPVSAIRVQVLAKNILGGVKFSRRKITEERNLLTETEFSKVSKIWLDNGIIHYIDTENKNLGFEFSNAGKAYLRDKAGLPPPTPNMETAQNDA